MEWGLIIIIIFVIAIAIFSAVSEKNKISGMSPQERGKYIAAQKEQNENFLLQQKWGEISPMMVCPHCNEKGKIRTKTIKRKKGISGGKATAAVFTAGLSMLATGLSRKEKWTQAHCCNCDNTWDF